MGAIGLIALSISRLNSVQYASLAGFAFLVTLILLLILICKASLRSSPLWLKIELVVCAILTICYIVGTIDIFRLCWYFLFDNFQLGHFIGSLIATVRIFWHIFSFFFSLSFVFFSLSFVHLYTFRIIVIYIFLFYHFKHSWFAFNWNCISPYIFLFWFLRFSTVTHSMLAVWLWCIGFF